LDSAKKIVFKQDVLDLADAMKDNKYKPSREQLDKILKPLFTDLEVASIVSKIGSHMGLINKVMTSVADKSVDETLADLIESQAKWLQILRQDWSDSQRIVGYCVLNYLKDNIKVNLDHLPTVLQDHNKTKMKKLIEKGKERFTDQMVEQNILSWTNDGKFLQLDNKLIRATLNETDFLVDLKIVAIESAAKVTPKIVIDLDYVFQLPSKSEL